MAARRKTTASPAAPKAGSTAARRPARSRSPRSRAGKSAAEPAAAARLEDIAARLAEAVAGIPSATDFEPLADHLYTFAATAPRLLESLQEASKVTGPVEASVTALRDVSETLQALHRGFEESLLKVPRAEDYEPLTGPLAEFARVAPLLRESLAELVRLAAPLAESVRSLGAVGETLRSAEASLARRVARLSPVGHPSAGIPAPALAELTEVAARVEKARNRLADALGTLPRDPQYARVAAHLREIATVSPSLLEWLGEVGGLSMPLGESIEGLEECVRELTAGHLRLTAVIRSLEPRGDASG